VGGGGFETGVSYPGSLVDGAQEFPPDVELVSSWLYIDLAALLYTAAMWVLCRLNSVVIENI
jgi:hypothetical protein